MVEEVVGRLHLQLGLDVGHQDQLGEGGQDGVEGEDTHELVHQARHHLQVLDVVLVEPHGAQLLADHLELRLGPLGTWSNIYQIFSLKKEEIRTDLRR